MTSFFENADRYLPPSASSRYRDAIDELNLYKEQLEIFVVPFYTRTDNLIPLLQAFEELLGSCDDNLVKQKESNDQPVSTFQADNYFYYAKGVATAMVSILHAVETDFDKTLEIRAAHEILHHAIKSCHHAAEMEPWLFVTEAELNGIFANHRANMAAHISHARFFVALLIETLST